MAAVYMDEDDVGTYTMKTVDDHRTLNKTVYLRPPNNILSQMELIEKWENITNTKLEKNNISGDDFLALMKDNNGVEASELYPEVQYTRMDTYLKRYA
ncbi:hypothetical protein Leryth_010863 [Lithospermum erythrorhizon]|nr:hypothetical protein Leryth_010863 [Lithospermum erythrorhizon]